ncbi:hypothetical protein SAMN04488508_10518 [Aquimarina spongiae]|uniref:Uncharacterized protein n=1 Tax=Aquimarina spongiae TaxID=570521 RepID=A0A1M6G1F1_9FLAO|nr:hypothetical protein SAMN04488508_10518 [Aquimarina spongiae]
MNRSKLYKLRFESLSLFKPEIGLYGIKNESFYFIAGKTANIVVVFPMKPYQNIRILDMAFYFLSKSQF